MTREELIDRTRALIAEGDGLDAAPSLRALRDWLQRSDELLEAAWGSMDRYHLAWLMVGKPKGIVRGRPLTPDEEAAEVRDVAGQKTSALRMSLDAVERQGMPFRGETGGIGIGRASAEPRVDPGSPEGATDPHDAGDPNDAGDAEGVGEARGVVDSGDAAGPRRGRFGLPSEADDLAERVRLAREQASLHADHDAPRAPRPPRMQR
ncbi:MAG TPA: hypothetical protein VIK16_06215 [Candidatus Limnocylindrales bacterium]